MDNGQNLFVGVARLEVHIPEARSLKDRRRALRPLIERLRNRHRVLVIETGNAELHQRAGLAICGLSSTAADLEQRFDRVRGTVDEIWAGMILSWDLELIQVAGE